MRRLKTRDGFTGAAITAAAFFMAAPAAAMAVTPVNSSRPTITGAAQVGVPLNCAPGSWDGPPPGYSYGLAWLRDGGTTISGATSFQYAPVASDMGHTVVCRVTATDFSSAAPNSASADSLPTAAIAPVASVTVTDNSPALSGSIGTAVTGVTVAVTLQRAGETIANASAVTGADGSWGR